MGSCTSVMLDVEAECCYPNTKDPISSTNDSFYAKKCFNFTSIISKPMKYSASFSCSVVSPVLSQKVLSSLGAPLIAHLSGKEAEAMPLN